MAYHLYFSHDYENKKKKLWLNIVILVFAMILNIISLVYTVTHGAED